LYVGWVIGVQLTLEYRRAAGWNLADSGARSRPSPVHAASRLTRMRHPSAVQIFTSASGEKRENSAAEQIVHMNR
jgi:hypothetical protein